MIGANDLCPYFPLSYPKNLVDLVGFEPTTSSMPWKRAPSCATGPLRKNLMIRRRNPNQMNQFSLTR
jgi:hypothetical protein